MNKTTEALKLAEEIFSGMLHGTDWNNGTHANIYRPKFPQALAAIREALAEQPTVLEDPHPPHRLCECTACLEYWTPLPDCDAFAASGKPIAEQEPVVDLSKVNHEDKCRYFDDERFCDCGADLYELLKWYRNKPVRTKDLTDDEIGEIYEKHHALGGCWTDGFAYERAVIAADREKNRG